MSTGRSDWEVSVERYIKRQYPALKIESNNRSIIPSRNHRGFHFEIDIFIPELRLGFEVNGENFHNREKYLNDLVRGTEYSDEAYKENYCKKVGIELIHVWSSGNKESIQREIDSAIQSRLADPTITPWAPPQKGSSLNIFPWAASLAAFLVMYFVATIGMHPYFKILIGSWAGFSTWLFFNSADTTEFMKRWFAMSAIFYVLVFLIRNSL